MLKSLVLKAIDACGYELRRRPSRNTLAGVLGQAKRIGFAPATVIDVGAAFGDFAMAAAAVFAEAEHLLVEPLAEYAPFIEAARRKIPRSHLVAAAAAATAGSVTMNVHPDLVGSSTYREDEDSEVNGVPRTVASATLDDMVAAKRLKAPFLLKIDVQGAELAVLDGAPRVLAESGLVILETSFFEFFQGAPQIFEVLAYMKAAGFVPYDICGLTHRPLDGALAQCDVAFVKERGPFRAQHQFATREQRAALTERLKRRPPAR